MKGTFFQIDQYKNCVIDKAVFAVIQKLLWTNQLCDPGVALK